MVRDGLRVEQAAEYADIFIMNFHDKKNTYEEKFCGIEH